MKILAITLLALLAPISAASTTYGEESETDPYCELTRNGAPQDYPGIGWYPEILRPDTAIGPAFVTVCEGEHWDGQDSVNGGAASDPSHACSGNHVDLARWTATLAIMQCADPGAQPPQLLPDPVGARASTFWDAPRIGSAASYAFLRARGVAGVGVFASACTGVFEPAYEAGHWFGSARCQTGGLSLGHVTFAVYVIDDTPFGMNVLAALVSSLDPGPPNVADADCSQATYAQSMWSESQGGPPTCSRDNTAITIEILA